MRRFIIQVLLVGAVPLAMVYAVAEWTVTDSQKFISKITPHKEIVVLGTSHGFDFKSISPRMAFLNFAKDGSTPYYDLQKMRWLHNHRLLEEEAVIILPVSYFAFGLDQNRTDRGPASGFENEFYFYLDRDQIYDYSLKKDIALRVFSFQEFVEKHTGIPKSFGGLSLDQQQIHPANPNKFSHEAQLQQHAKGRVRNHQRLANYAPETPNYLYFQQLLKEAKAHGYRPILVTVPYSSFYNNGFNQAWLDKEYFSKMQRLAEETGVPYLNYSAWPEISDRPELFEDSDHLNEAGTDVFNALFFDDLQAYYNFDRIMEK